MVVCKNDYSREIHDHERGRRDGWVIESILWKKSYRREKSIIDWIILSWTWKYQSINDPESTIMGTKITIWMGDNRFSIWNIDLGRKKSIVRVKKHKYFGRENFGYGCKNGLHEKSTVHVKKIIKSLPCCFCTERTVFSSPTKPTCRPRPTSLSHSPGLSRWCRATSPEARWIPYRRPSSFRTQKIEATSRFVHHFFCPTREFDMTCDGVEREREKGREGTKAGGGQLHRWAPRWSKSIPENMLFPCTHH